MIGAKIKNLIKSRVRLTTAGRYWVAVAVGLVLVGVYKYINLILLMAYFLIALVMLNWWLTRSALKHLAVTLEPFSDGFAGEPRTIRGVLTNHGRRIIRGTQVVAAVGDHECSWYVPQLNAGEAVVLLRSISSSKRGIYPVGEVQLRNSFPFGLVETTAKCGEPRTFACYPRRGDIDFSKLLRQSQTQTLPLGYRRTAVRQLTEGTDIHGLRPFRAGDSPRWIHWRTTARVGELMVREFDRASGPRLTIVVVPSDNDQDFLEASLQLAGTIVWEWSRRQDGRLKLWIPNLGRWECMTLDHRRRAEKIMRRLAAISNSDFQCAELAPTIEDMQPRTRFVYITKGQTEIGTMKSAGALWLDPTVETKVYHPPIAFS